MERIIPNSEFAYYYCVIIIIIINVLSELKSMNCHLGKYVLFPVYGYVCTPEQIVYPWG